MDGLPHGGVETHGALRALSAEQMEDVARAINERLPESMRIAFGTGERKRLRGLLEDMLGYPRYVAPPALAPALKRSAGPIRRSRRAARRCP